MVRVEDIIDGRYLRTRSDSFAVPVGTVVQVDSVGMNWQGEFVFTVRWLNIRAGTQQPSRSHRSLNLWEHDLPTSRRCRKEKARRRLPRHTVNQT
jgi:hypothetical protein